MLQSSTQSLPINSGFYLEPVTSTIPAKFDGVFITKQPASKLKSYHSLPTTLHSHIENGSPDGHILASEEAALGLAATLTKAFQENAALNEHALTPKSIKSWPPFTNDAPPNKELSIDGASSSQRILSHPSFENTEESLLDIDDLLEVADAPTHIDKEYQKLWDSLSDNVTDRNLHYIRKQKAFIPPGSSDMITPTTSQSRYLSYVSMLREMFGPGDIKRGEGKKPRKVSICFLIILTLLSFLQSNLKNFAVKARSKKLITKIVVSSSSEEGSSSKVSEMI